MIKKIVLASALSLILSLSIHGGVYGFGFNESLHYELCESETSSCGGQFPPNENYRTLSIWCQNGSTTDYEVAIWTPPTDGYTGDHTTCDVADDLWLIGSNFTEWINSVIFEIPAGRADECDGGEAQQDYNACAAIAVSSRTIAAPPERRAASGGPIQFPPSVTLERPKSGSFSSIVDIQYSASDSNDISDADTKARFGLSDTPVTIYFSDLIDFWDHRIIPAIQKLLVAKDLGAIGNYKWDVSGVPDGDRYRVIVSARDGSGLEGEDVSDFISIDHSAPVFIISTDPAATKGEDVKITVEASEALLAAPRLGVIQKGYEAVFVDLADATAVDAAPEDRGKIFKGVYRVISGYDGIAKLSINGKDKAGNPGDLILGAGSFSIGINPPPKPVVLLPLDKEIVKEEKITVTGRSREDTEIILTVNGKSEYKVRADASGDFIIKDVLLAPEFNKGRNILGLVSKDRAGNFSEAATIEVKFNLDPDVAILEPITGDVASSTIPISVKAADKNNDQLLFNYEISDDKGVSWTMLAEKTLTRRYLLDTTQFADGKYLVRVTVADGFAAIQAISGEFRINNRLPGITFDDGSRTTTNKPDYKLSGKVSLPEGSRIISLTYSLDGGKEYRSLPIGSVFQLPLSSLEEKTYQILFRAENGDGKFGRAKKILIVDFGPPPRPSVTNPKPEVTFSDFDDENPDLAGTQIRVSGSAEPGGESPSFFRRANFFRVC